MLTLWDLNRVVTGVEYSNIFTPIHPIAVNIRIARVPTCHVGNLEMLQPRASTPNFDCGWTETRVSIWRWELLILPAEISFGTIPFPGGVSTSPSSRQSLFSPAMFFLFPHRKSLASESFRHWSSRLTLAGRVSIRRGHQDLCFKYNNKELRRLLPEYKTMY